MTFTRYEAVRRAFIWGDPMKSIFQSSNIIVCCAVTTLLGFGCESKLAVSVRDVKKCATTVVEGECAVSAEQSKSDLKASDGTMSRSGVIAVQLSVDEEISSFDPSKLEIENGEIDQSSGSAYRYENGVYIVNIKAKKEGVVKVKVPKSTFLTKSKKPVAESTTELKVLYDATSPTATLSTTASQTTDLSPIPVTVEFSESVAGLTASCFTVSNGQASTVTGSSTSYKVQVVPSAVGVVTVLLKEACVKDTAGNPNKASAVLTRTYGANEPAVTITSSTNASVKTLPIPVTVTFSKSVTGFVAGDLTLSNGTVSNFAGSGTTYTFDLTATAQGPVTIDIAANVAATSDGYGNTQAAQFTRSYDTTAPSVTLSSTTAASVNGPFTVTATFSEAVFNLSSSAVTVGGGTISNFSGSGTTYSFTVTPSSSVTVDLASGSATDAAGNQNTAATQLTRSYDATAPTVTLSTAEPDPTRNSSMAFTITVSETTTNLTSSSLTLVNSTVSGFTGSGTSYSFNLIPSGQGSVSVGLPAGSFTDIAGNSSVAATTITRTYDSVPPSAPTSPVCTGGDNSVAVSWTTGGGDTAGFIVVRRYGTNPTFSPTGGTTYSNTTTNNLDDYTHWLSYVGASTSFAETDVYPGMPHNFAIFAYDSLKNYQSPIYVNCTPLPMAMLDNVPALSFTGTNINVKVEGQGVYEYKYALVNYEYYCDEVTYSSWISASTPITAAPNPGPNRLCVLGRDSSGNAQVSATQTYFVKASHISIDHPNVWNNKVQQGDNFKIEWVDHNAADDASGTVAFYYASSQGANCSGATTIATGISQNTSNKFSNWNTSGVPVGTYYICVESYDGTSTYSFWANGTVTVENYCTGSTLTNTLASNNNGTGISSDPYNICTLTQLDEMASMTQTNKYYRLRRTIDATPTSGWNSGAGWNARNITMAQFDGNGYTIDGLFINRPSTGYIGLFAQTTGGATPTIKDLRLASINMTGGQRAGALCAYCTGTFTRIFVSGSFTGDRYVGGLFGHFYNSGTMSLTRIRTNVTMNGYYFWRGQLAGQIDAGATVNKIITQGTVGFSGPTSSNQYVGGVIGFSNSSASDLLSTTNVPGGATMGGLIGYIGTNNSYLRNSVVAGDVVASAGSTGFAIGYSGGSNFSVTNLTMLGNMTGTVSGYYFGGAVASPVGTFHMTGIMNFGSANISGGPSYGSYLGGIVGYPPGVAGQSTIYMVKSRANLTNNASFVGGIAGACGYQNTHSIVLVIDGAVSSGTLTAPSTVGGIAAYLSGPNAVIRNSYSTANVTNLSGGFVGTIANYSKVINTYATGTGNGQFNYLSGTSATIANSFSAASTGPFAVTRNSDAGVFTNVFFYKPGGNASNCIGTDNASSGTQCTAVTSLATYQSSSNAPLSSWDFTNMWKIPGGGGYPKLKWEAD
jgi:hypothetical protein